MSKKRFSLWMLVLVSFVSAALATLLMTRFSRESHGSAVDKVYSETEEESSQFKPAAWFEAKPASFADLAEKVQGAVVNINTSKSMHSRSPNFFFGPRDPFFDDFFERFFEGMPDTPKEYKQRSLGSGFIISKDGEILTNNHVISQADEIEVQLADGKKFKAEVVGRDEMTDIALIRIKGAGDLPFVELGDSDIMRPGDWVMAIGNPFGLAHTVTVGVVSAMGRLLGEEGAPTAKFIQTDASINPGNSGGPLFNIQGQVIGINTMINASGQNIGFAIPINLAKEMLPQLSSKGSVTRGWLGVGVQNITSELAKSFNLPDEKGGLISEVQPNSPAERAGVKQGDIVREFNGEKIEDSYSLTRAVGKTEPGKTVPMTVIRDGKELFLNVKVDKREGEEKIARGEGGNDADRLGLVIGNITTGEVKNGVLVRDVKPDSPADEANIMAGDVILEVNGIKTNSVSDYDTVVQRIQNGDFVRFLVKRRGATIYFAFKVDIK